MNRSLFAAHQPALISSAKAPAAFSVRSLRRTIASNRNQSRIPRDDVPPDRLNSFLEANRTRSNQQARSHRRVDANVGVRRFNCDHAASLHRAIEGSLVGIQFVLAYSRHENSHTRQTPNQPRFAPSTRGGGRRDPDHRKAKSGGAARPATARSSRMGQDIRKAGRHLGPQAASREGWE